MECLSYVYGVDFLFVISIHYILYNGSCNSVCGCGDYTYHVPIVSESKSWDIRTDGQGEIMRVPYFDYGTLNTVTSSVMVDRYSQSSMLSDWYPLSQMHLNMPYVLTQRPNTHTLSNVAHSSISVNEHHFIIKVTD